MKNQNFTIKEKDQIILDIADIKMHVDILNSETGELRDTMKQMKKSYDDTTGINAKDISSIQCDLGQVKNDVSWLKQTYWVIAGAAGGGFVMAILNLLIKK